MPLHVCYGVMEEGSCQLFFLILKAVLLCFILLKHEKNDRRRKAEGKHLHQTHLKGIQGGGEVGWWYFLDFGHSVPSEWYRRLKTSLSIHVTVCTTVIMKTHKYLEE